MTQEIIIGEKPTSADEHITPEQYQERINRYRLSSYTPEAAVLGLFEECGEVSGVFTKLLRGDYGLDTAMPKLAKELGDVLFNIACICNDNDWKMSDIMQANLDKLESRQIRGKILGEGSER